jgi:hypothetical protein
MVPVSLFNKASVVTPRCESYGFLDISRIVLVEPPGQLAIIRNPRILWHVRDPTVMQPVHNLFLKCNAFFLDGQKTAYLGCLLLGL